MTAHTGDTMGSARRWFVALFIVGVVAGCGGGGGGDGTSGGTNGEAAKSAPQILADTEAALSRVKSVHLEGTIKDKDGKTGLSGDIVLPGRLRLTLHNGKQVIDLEIVGRASYIKANRVFWSETGAGGAVAARLTDRWVKTPSDALGEVAHFEAATDPATIGRCFLGPHFGTITKAGTDSVNGQKVVVLADAGDQPGSQPGRLYITSEGAPLPLRLTESGAMKPGASPDARCRETKSDVSDTSPSSGDLRFSYHDKQVSIAPPPDAIDLSQLGTGTST